MMSDIAVTGIGIKCPLGLDSDTFWKNCRKARNAIAKIDQFDTSAFRSDIAGWVKNFNPKDALPPGKLRRMSRVSKLAVAASVEAIEDSHLFKAYPDKNRVAVIMGTAYGSTSHVDIFFDSLLQGGPRGAQPLYFPETVPNAPASHIAMVHGITGPNTTFSQNLISAESAIIYGRQLLLQNRADAVLAGGADEISALQYSGYDAIRALNPVKISSGHAIAPHPGGGMVLGEGAGILILERIEAAIQRGARIYGCIKTATAAGGPVAMGHYDITATQTTRTISDALRKAGLEIQDMDQLNVAANYTEELDAMEYRLLNELFGGVKTDIGVTPLKYLWGISAGPVLSERPLHY